MGDGEGERPELRLSALEPVEIPDGDQEPEEHLGGEVLRSLRATPSQVPGDLRGKLTVQGAPGPLGAQTGSRQDLGKRLPQRHGIPLTCCTRPGAWGSGHVSYARSGNRGR